MKLPTKRWVDPSGAIVMVETSHRLPLVDVEVAFRVGSIEDPKGKEGLSRMMWRVLRMGTRALESAEVEESIARLGGRMAIHIATSYVRVQGVVIRKNLEPFCELVFSLLREPAFRKSDLDRARAEVLAELISLRDDDRALAGRAFRTALFGKHPYARPVAGWSDSIRRVTPRDLRATYKADISAKDMIVAFAGDIDAATARRLVRAQLKRFPSQRPRRTRLAQPLPRPGRHVIIVDKPERSQTQLLVGGLGIEVGETDHMPLMVGNTAFGGTFTSRLTQAVREERGWSYGASSHLGADRVRDVWFMSSAPAITDATKCIALEIELLEALHRDGLTRAEFTRGRDYLVLSQCFDVDTAMKRLEPRVDEAIYGLPFGTFAKEHARIRRVKLEQVNRAVRKLLPREDLVISLVATAKNIRKDVAKLPGVVSVTVVPHTRV